MDFSWYWFFIVATVFVGVCACGWWAGMFSRAWRWLRVLSLGGATTLDRNLDYTVCTLCRYGLLAGQKVRTLSCDHVFHRGGTGRCVNGIDKWLLTAPRMICPLCHQTLHSVLPWKPPPPNLEEQTPPPSLTPVSTTTSETPQSSSGYGNDIPPPQSSSGLESISPPPLASPGSYDIVIEVRPPPSSSGLENTSPPESSSGQDDLDKPLLSRSQSA